MNKLLAGRAILPLIEGHTVPQEISTPATEIRGIELHSILTDNARLYVQGIIM
jgi:hypothetical protein